MAKKTTAEILDELDSEAATARVEMGSSKHGLVRPGEESTTVEDDSEEEDDSSEEDDDQQDIENEDDQEEDEPDEEPDEDDDDQEENIDDRQRNREAAQRRIESKKDKEIAELRAELSKFESAKTEAKRQTIQDKIGEIAGRLNLDPAGLSEIALAISEITESNLETKLPPKEIMDEYNARQEEKYFDTEWNAFVPELTKIYPKLTVAQATEAKKLMDGLSHDEITGGIKIMGKDGKPRLQPYALDYIMYKNKSDFDSLLSPSKRRGLESASVSPTYELDDDAPDMSTARGIDKMDKIYAGIESQSSGLRRGRSPKNRSI